LLEKYQIRPSKKLGQNFLTDERIVKKVVKAAEFDLKDSALEIGPGLGVLTQELAKKTKKVVAIEKDPKMIEILKETLKDLKNVEVFQGDILKISDSQSLISDYKIVANLPFYLTTPVIRKFLEVAKVKPKQMILVVQKEVAQRICAKPPDMSILAISVQLYAKPEIIGLAPRESFWPEPKVESAIIKITPKKTRWKSSFHCLFFKVVKAGFSQPRKQLINNLSQGLRVDREKVKSWLLENNIQPTQRAETLALQDWILLTKSVPR